MRNCAAIAAAAAAVVQMLTNEVQRNLLTCEAQQKAQQNWLNCVAGIVVAVAVVEVVRVTQNCVVVVVVVAMAIP